MVLVIETPEAGSPKNVREVKPGSYQRTQYEPWRSATRPPNRKAAAIQRFFDQCGRQEEAVREFLRPDAAGLKVWLASAHL